MVESSDNCLATRPVIESAGFGLASGEVSFGRPLRQPRLYAVALLLGLTLLTTILSGCSTRIEVLSRVFPSSSPAATVALGEHALSILGVDFDPRLQGTTIDLTDPEAGITLMVAVANQGQSDENDVQVSATLVDSPNGQPVNELLNETTVIKVLKAGEVRVVRFGPVTQLPQRDRYQLRVAVQPVTGETQTADNFHTYDIIVHRGQ